MSKTSAQSPSSKRKQAVDDIVTGSNPSDMLEAVSSFDGIHPTKRSKPESTLVSASPSTLTPSPPQTAAHTVQQSSSRGSAVEERFGDLFACPAEASLAHCISADCALGKGIALQFKERFGGVDKLKAQKVAVGGCAVLHHPPRYIYNLVSKQKYWQKPDYNTLTASLQAMRDHAIAHSVTHICMPRIGCGLDRLSWERVRRIVDDMFRSTTIQITVYQYQP